MSTRLCRRYHHRGRHYDHDKNTAIVFGFIVAVIAALLFVSMVHSAMDDRTPAGLSMSPSYLGQKIK